MFRFRRTIKGFYIVVKFKQILLGTETLELYLQYGFRRTYSIDTNNDTQKWRIINSVSQNLHPLVNRDEVVGIVS